MAKQMQEDRDRDGESQMRPDQASVWSLHWRRIISFLKFLFQETSQHSETGGKPDQEVCVCVCVS